jgi:hypothetical protein
MTEKLEGRVVVVKEFARRASGTMPSPRIREKNIGNARESRGMCEEVVDGDWFEGRINAEPGQIVEDRLLEVKFAFLMELQEAICKKAFADRANLKKLVGLDSLLLFDVAEAVGDDTLYAVAIGENECEARGVHRTEIVFREVVESLEDGFVGRGIGISERFKDEKI